MSDRLISADKLRALFDDDYDSSILASRLQFLIDKQPTAYDVDEKIKRIEKLQEDYSHGTGSYEDYDDYCQGGANALSEALDIVKGGAE